MLIAYNTGNWCTCILVFCCINEFTVIYNKCRLSSVQNELLTRIIFSNHSEMFQYCYQLFKRHFMEVCFAFQLANVAMKSVDCRSIDVQQHCLCACLEMNACRLVAGLSIRPHKGRYYGSQIESVPEAAAGRRRKGKRE